MKYTDIKQFNLLSLNAKSVIHAIQKNKKYSTSKLDSKSVKFLSLHETEDYSKYIESEDAHDANALTDQLCLTLIDKFQITIDSYYYKSLNEDSLKHYLMYVNFKDIYGEFYTNDIATPQGEAFETLITNGINISIPKQTNPEASTNASVEYDIVKFLPFDKSGSMSRSYRITFIRADIITDINKRLLLDMDFSKLSIIPSKYYAYKGLYLSDGVRVTQDNLGQYALNSNNVIVLPDKIYIQNNINVITNYVANDTLSFKNETKKVDINCFDGEGIISPELADAIRQTIGNDDLNTFQIRMPFAKGLLHQVDFKTFIKKEFLQNENYTDPIYIKDFFGIKRDILSADIILSESMLKCCSWLQKYKNIVDRNINDAKKQWEDPMVYYFNEYNKYNHSLFICNAKHTPHTDKYVYMSYQFLNTLKLNSDNFKTLVDEHKKQINELMQISDLAVETRSAKLKKLLGVDENSKHSYQKALFKNDAFFSDAYIRGLFKSIMDSMSKKIATGNLLVKGTQRYLSGDLLYFLLYICEVIQIDSSLDSTKSVLQNIKNQCLNQYTMFAPNTGWMQQSGFKHKTQSSNSKNTENYFGIMRNPHYARHEQCILKLHNNYDNTSLYQKYFNHLTSVVMISHNSLVPATLGGADFDGDIVKLIADSTVCKAIANGVYDTAPDKKIDRVLPYPQIQGQNGLYKSVESDKIDLPTLKNTFGNSIGQISNSAIKLGENYYPTLDSTALDKTSPHASVSDDTTNPVRDYNIECTILAGLEIDAAKSGWHPSKELKSVISSANAHKEYKYLKNKDIIDNAKIPNISTISKTEKRKDATNKDIDVDVEYYTVYNKPIVEKRYAEILTDSIIPNLERLPAYYAQYELYEKPKSFTYSDLTKGKKKFAFENNKKWKSELDSDMCSKVLGMMDAYNKVIDLTNNHYSYYSSNYNNYNLACIKHILNKQYHNYKQGKNTAYNNLLELFDKYISDLSSAKLALDRLKKNNYSPTVCTLEWLYTPENKRLEKLCEILGIDKSIADNPDCKEALMLLCNFKYSGYMLLYFLLKDSIAKHTKSIFNENDAIPDEIPKNIGEIFKLKSNIYETQYNELFDKLLSISKDGINKKQDKNSLINQINQCTNGYLYKLTKKESIKYVYSLVNTANTPKYSRFMWNIIRWADIESNIWTPKKEESENA